MWRFQESHLAESCRVIAPDLRGFGNSSLAPGDDSTGVEMARYAADLLALLDELGVTEPVILCGFSMGGYILWQFALAYPQRVRAVVVCDSRSDADSAEGRQGRLKMADEVVQSGTEPVAEAMIPRLLAHQTQQSRAEVVEQVRSLIVGASPEAIAAAQRGMARREDVGGRLSEITCPALLLVGEEDAISPPAHMREIAAGLPRGELVEIQAAGHMTVLENPAAVNSALERFVHQV